MNCRHAHQEIEHILAQDVRPTTELRQHLVSCQTCRTQWQEQALQQWLPEILETQVPMDLQANILAAVASSKADKAPSYKWPGAMMLAASLFVMILLGPFKGFQSEPAIQVVQVSVGQVEQVQLVVAAAQDYQGANISVSMSPGMSLDTAGKVSQFNWQTSLRKGDNLLALPIYLMHEDGGMVKVEFSSEQGTKQIQLKVQAKSPQPDAAKGTLSI